MAIWRVPPKPRQRIVKAPIGWTNISKVNGVTAANISKVNSVLVANIAKVNGVAV